jgi:thioredoxin reductase
MSSSQQIAVVGGGLSGIMAAMAASRSGASVVLIDENEQMGGWMRTCVNLIEKPPTVLEGLRGFEAADYGRRVLATSTIDCRTNSVVWGLFENRTLAVAGPDGAYQLQPDRIILATGSTAIVWPFEGWTLPGVMTAQAARAFMHLHFVLPGNNVAVIGRGKLANQMADDLELAGATVASRLDSPDAVVAGGSGAVEWIETSGTRTEVDAIILALGSLPDPELARHAMAQMEYSLSNGCHVPVRDAHMATSIDGVYLVGDAGGRVQADAAAAQGYVAGFAATGSDELAGAMTALADSLSDQSAHMDVGDPALIPNDVQVDREEQITAAQIREAIANGAVSINDVKRRTRAGMGASQGRDTEYVIARMIRQQTGISIDQLVPMTARPPTRLVSLSDLAKIAVSGD